MIAVIFAGLVVLFVGAFLSVFMWKIFKWVLLALTVLVVIGVALYYLPWYWSVAIFGGLIFLGNLENKKKLEFAEKLINSQDGKMIDEEFLRNAFSELSKREVDEIIEKILNDGKYEKIDLQKTTLYALKNRDQKPALVID